MATADEIVVRSGAGRALLAGPVPACPAGRAIVALPGGEVHLDPAAPDDPPLLVLRDPAEAGPAVAELLGPAALDAVRRAADGPVTTAWSPGSGWAAVRRAGLCRWLRRHGPDVLPAALLDLDEGVAATATELDAWEHTAAQGLLSGSAATAARLSELARIPGLPPTPPGLPELLASALVATLEWAPLDAATADRLRHEQDLGEALRRFGAAGRTIDWSALAAIPEVGGREPAAAGAAGGADDPGYRGSVDWHQVPRGVLDTAEDTVSWTVSGDVIEVNVRARPGGPDHPGLAFRVYAPSDPFPLGRSTLHRSPDGTRFRGRTRLRPTATGPGGLAVDVFDATDRRRPRLGVDAVGARALRWAARGVTLVRLAGTGVTADGVAAEALREAEALHDEVAETHPDDERRALALRCAARCAGLRRAVLVRAGEDRQASAIGRAWTDVGEPVTAADVAVPDLDRPGWRPLAAEHALTGPGVWWG
ncbi:hypothetical protein [Pseudonocardia sp. ICBG1034]|uniref:hypothetical protein n=1 Tax=Pseudonocardia sp. ICBG1034 TaxID=2844381 RepID=UPI001CCA6589|nr:hypothetical protein [Pseudonocardia sp. ICBG1034]